jgi:hypothetical protein
VDDPGEIARWVAELAHDVAGLEGVRRGLKEAKVKEVKMKEAKKKR